MSRALPIVEPATCDEAGAALAAATARGERSFVRGRGSAGVDPIAQGAAQVIATRRLDRVREYRPADLVIEVECGIGWETLQAQLATERQRVPLDPPRGGTLGGVLADNRCGPLRGCYGTPRDWVLGVRLIRPDGVMVRSGGAVVKNVSGYDLGKLVIGARGRLGLIACATLKLAPLPAAQAALAATLPNLELALQAARALVDRAAALQLTSSPPETECTLQARFEGWQELVDRAWEDAASACAAWGASVSTNGAESTFPAECSWSERGCGLGWGLVGATSRELSLTLHDAARNEMASACFTILPACGWSEVWWAPGEPTRDRRFAQVLVSAIERHGGAWRTLRWPHHEPLARAAGDAAARRLEAQLLAAFDPTGALTGSGW